MGYKKKGVPSPYLYSYTQFYEKGKYEFDGKYNPELVSKQPGVVAIMKALGI
jgi:lysozyme family protein